MTTRLMTPLSSAPSSFSIGSIKSNSQILPTLATSPVFKNALSSLTLWNSRLFGSSTGNPSAALTMSQLFGESSKQQRYIPTIYLLAVDPKAPQSKALVLTEEKENQLSMRHTTTGGQDAPNVLPTGRDPAELKDVIGARGGDGRPRQSTKWREAEDQEMSKTPVANAPCIRIRAASQATLVDAAARPFCSELNGQATTECTVKFVHSRRKTVESEQRLS
ncbi:unnamed protein product [Caenorhabditis brenneri]